MSQAASETKGKVAVIGATGMLGLPVARQLVRAGFRTYALGRSEAKVRDGLGAAVEFVPCDLADRASVDRALAGMDFVYLNLSVVPTEGQRDFHPEGEGLGYVLEAARKHGVRRLGYISSIIARDGDAGDWWVFTLKRKAIRDIQASGVPYAIFYPSSFMENLTHGFIQGSRINIVGTPRFPNWWIAGDDYGRQVARAFEVLKASENRDYTVQGPEPLMMRDAVEQFVAHYTKQKLTVGSAPLWLLKGIGLFKRELRYVTRVLDVINNTEERFLAQQTWDELGKPTITVKDFARAASLPPA